MIDQGYLSDEDFKLIRRFYNDNMVYQNLPSNLILNFTGNKDDKSWNNFISNEYRCLSFDISDLLDENYSFNITCKEGKQFYYIS